MYIHYRQGVVVTSSDQDLPPSCDNLRSCRTMWGIVWSCLTTILLCTWTAIHPNIPGPNEAWIRIAARKVKIMVLALIAPELVVAWAIRQRFVADRLANEYRGYGWTRAHGFFAIMGGFMLFSGHTAEGTIHPGWRGISLGIRNISDYIEEGQIHITEEEIRDRSKRDILSKTLMLLQTGWFVLQYLARAIQHLPITELETVTLAFAALSFVIYKLWWDKPHNVGRPVPVNRTGQAQPLAKQRTFHNIHEAITALRQTPRRDPPEKDSKSRNWRDATKEALSDPMNLIIWPLVEPFAEMAGTELEDHDQFRVGTFYAGKLDRDEEVKLALFVGGIATIFGAIHCIAWSFHFSTPAEQMIWRISSVATASAPTLLFGTAAIASIFNEGKIKTAFTALSVFLLMLLYGIARVMLLVLAVTSLRSLPYDAYKTVYWTTFIPHI